MHRILCIRRKLLETCRLRVRFCPAGIGRRLQRGGKQQKRRLAKSLTGHDCRDRHNSIGADYAESVHNSGGKFLTWWQKQTNVLAVGGDNSRQMLRLASERNGVDHGQLQQFDAARLPFVDKSVDVVFGHAVYHHMDSPAKAFRDARRVLKPCGIFYVFVRQGDFRGRQPVGAGAIYYRYYEAAELVLLLQDAGFQVIRLETVKDPYPERAIGFLAAFCSKTRQDAPRYPGRAAASSRERT